MASSKGKEKLMERNSGKRKEPCSDDDNTGSRKRRNRAVLQLFEDSAVEVHGDSDSSSNDEDEFDINDFLEDEVINDVKANNEPVKVPLVSFIKEEEMDDAELERMVEERYGRGSSFIRYAEDGYDDREAVDQDENLLDFRDTTIWKLKCMVGHEKHYVYCLMQKYVHLQTLGTKLQITSAFSLDHVEGFIYIEAHSQQDLYEACKGLLTVYVSQVTTVPPNQHAHVLSVRSKGCGITADMWARVKRGKYKGDLARIVAVNEVRKRATVKLIPRIDLRVLAEKFGGGVPVKRTGTAILPRLISSTELEEYRPLIQNRRDRDTNMNFEVLDGMMLKDGYLYKKIAIDSLTVWGAMPTEDELLKFEQPNNNEYMDLEFLTDLYGNANRKTKQCMNNDGGDEKGEGSSISNMEYDFEVHDLVFFGKRDFGVIIGMEKDNNFKIMKEGTEGPVVLTLSAKNLKRASFDKKLFTSQDGHMQKISINDRVRVIDGLLKDKEGVVKHIYGGIIFLYNEREDEHNGYICFKSQKCEKVLSADEASHEQGTEPGSSVFGESSPSPKTPPCSDKAWQRRENKSFNQEDKNAMFSVGQSLRIRVGPLKGYLCCILAIRRTNVIVKLDSQNKILTVKREHLSEVRGRSLGSVTGGDHESAEPFDRLGTTVGSREIQDQADKKQSWGNQGGSSWKKQDGGSSWNKDGGSSLSNPTGSTWGQQADANTEDVHCKTEHKQSFDNQTGPSWNKPNSRSSWKGKDGGSGLNNPTGGSWGKQVNDKAKSHGTAGQNQSWGSQGGSSWKKQDGGPGWSKSAGGSSWSQQADAKAGDLSWGARTDRNKSWGVQGSSSWSKPDGGPTWSNPAGGLSWGAKAEEPSKTTKQPQSGFRGRGGRGGSWRGGPGGRVGRGEPDRDGYGGRGGSDRCGFRGRGGSFGGREGSERGGYGGRGRSARGGFRGRGRSVQGGFGGRGCGKSDQYGGDHNNINNSGEANTTSWSKSSWTSDGGSFNEIKGNWNQGGAYGGQKKGWYPESQSKGNIDGADGDGGQRKSWNSGGSWSKPKNTGGWNQGYASGSGNAPGTWNKPFAKDARNTEKVKETSEIGGPTHQWENAAGRSWGKSKGGW